MIVFGCGIEASATEAKGTVLLKSAEELLNYNKSEERKLEEIVESIAACGAKVPPDRTAEDAFTIYSRVCSVCSKHLHVLCLSAQLFHISLYILLNLTHYSLLLASYSHLTCLLHLASCLRLTHILLVSRW